MVGNCWFPLLRLLVLCVLLASIAMLLEHNAILVRLFVLAGTVVQLFALGAFKLDCVILGHSRVR